MYQSKGPGQTMLQYILINYFLAFDLFVMVFEVLNLRKQKSFEFLVLIWRCVDGSVHKKLKGRLISSYFWRYLPKWRPIIDTTSRKVKSGDTFPLLICADYVYDTLAIESERNLSLPDWTKGYFPGGKFEVELRDVAHMPGPRADWLERGPKMKVLSSGTLRCCLASVFISHEEGIAEQFWKHSVDLNSKLFACRVQIRK